MTQHESAPNPTTDDFRALVDQLTVDQMRFVVARQEYGSDKEAAESIRVSPETVKNWKYKGAPIDEVVRLLAFDGMVIARKMRRRNLAKAMAIKVAGLDSEDERLRQGVSTEIIEWEMGRAAQPQTHSGPDGGPIQSEQVVTVGVSNLSDDDLDALAAIARRIGADTD